MAKILLHTLTFSPDGTSTAYLVTDLVRQLKRLGHSVTVLTTTPHYNLDQAAIDRQPMRKLWCGLVYRSDCDGIPVFHVKMPMKGGRVTSRLLDYVRFHIISVLAGLLMVGSYDIIIAPSPPLTIGMVSWLLGVLRRAPSVYNVQEIYPDFAINQGLMHSPLFIGFTRWIERFVYRRNTKIVPISEWFSQTIRERVGADEKLCVIPNFVDTEFNRPLPRVNQFAEKHGLVDNFVVLYGGNLGLSQDWEAFLYAAAKLAHLPITFVITGDGVRREWLEEEIKKRGLENVKLLGYQPRELVPLIYASCDISTIPMKSASTLDTFPSKIYTIMAYAKSVIVSADEDSELSWIVKQSGCGRAIPPEDPEAYAEAVYQAYLERDSLSAEGARGRQFVEQGYSKEVAARRYDDLIQQLVNNGRVAPAYSLEVNGD